MHTQKLPRLAELSRSIEASIIASKNLELLPLSFFSESYDTLREMTRLLQAIETEQLEKMQAQLQVHKQFVASEEIRSVQEKELPPIACSTAPAPAEPKPAGDRVWKIALSDSFLFTKELFGGSKETMEATLDELSQFTTLEEAKAYLNAKFDWDWESEAASIFKVLLETSYG